MTISNAAEIVRRHAAIAVVMADQYFLEQMQVEFEPSAETFTRDMDEIVQGIAAAARELLADRGLSDLADVVCEAVVDAFFHRWSLLCASQGGQA
jgi:hypothetical protein